MIETVKKLSEQHLKFIEEEFGIDSDSLTVFDKDQLYEKVYDPCCVIEEKEIVATIDDDSELSERGKTASEIVTILGETIC